MRPVSSIGRRAYWTFLVWRQARRDAKIGAYSPEDTIKRRLGFRFTYNPYGNPIDPEPDAEDQQNEERLMGARDVAGRLQDVVESLKKALAKFVHPRILLFVQILIGLLEAGGMIVLVGDLGVDASHRFVIGVLVTLGTMYGTWRLNDHGREKGVKSKSFLVFVGVYSIVMLALTIARITVMSRGRGITAGDIAIGVILCISTLAPPWFFEAVFNRFHQVQETYRLYLNAWRERRKALLTIKTCEAYIVRRQRHANWYKEEDTRLSSLYNITHRSAIARRATRQSDHQPR